MNGVPPTPCAHNAVQLQCHVPAMPCCFNDMCPKCRVRVHTRHGRTHKTAYDKQAWDQHMLQVRASVPPTQSLARRPPGCASAAAAVRLSCPASARIRPFRGGQGRRGCAHGIHGARELGARETAEACPTRVTCSCTRVACLHCSHTCQQACSHTCRQACSHAHAQRSSHASSSHAYQHGCTPPSSCPRKTCSR